MPKQVFTTGQVPTAADFNLLAQDANLKGTDTVNAGSGSLAGSVLELTQTWNTTGNPSAISLDVTNTASGASANLMNLKVGGVSKLKVDKSGSTTIYVADSGSITVDGDGDGLRTHVSGKYSCFGSYGIRLSTANDLAWGSTDNGPASADTKLFRDAANTLAQRNGTAAQAFRVYNTYTDASNYERGVFDWTTTANTLTIGTQNAGTGIGRSLKLAPGAFTIFGFHGSSTNHAAHDANAGFTLIALRSFGWSSANDATTGMDTGLSRASAAVVKVTNGSSGYGALEASTLRTATAYTVSTLPTGSAGMRAYVTDATAPTFLGALTGGGSVVTPVFHNGSAWVAG